MLNEARASERAKLEEPFTDNQLIIASVHECSGSLSELEKNAILENKGQPLAWHIRELMEIALWYGKSQGKISQKADDRKLLETLLEQRKENYTKAMAETKTARNLVQLYDEDWFTIHDGVVESRGIVWILERAIAKLKE